MKLIIIAFCFLGIFLIAARADLAQDVCGNKNHSLWRTQQAGYLKILSNMSESDDFDEVFVTTRKVGKMLGIDKDSPWDKVNINRNTLMSFACYYQIYFCASSFFMFEAKTFYEYTESFYMSFTSNGSAVNLMFLIWKSQEVHQLMSNIEKTYKKRSDNPVSRRIYEELNDKIERMTWKFFVSLVVLTPVGITFPNAIMSYYQYFISGMGADAFELSFLGVMPFEYKNPYIYSIAFTAQTTSFVFIMFGCVYNMSFIVGLSYSIQAFTRDIKQELKSLTGTNADQENYKTSNDLIREFVEVHGKIKQFVADFSEIYSFVLTGCLAWCLITICSVLLLVQFELDAGTGNSLMWVKTGTFLFWSFGKAVILCENAQDITNRFEDLDYEICQMDWWTFPLKIKRLLPMIMINSQQPVIVQSFGNLECSRLTLKTIASGGISYFITVREFA